MLTRTMPDFREVVRRTLRQRGMSKYDLVQALKGKGENGKDVPAVTVYEFLRDDKPTAINSTYLGLIFDVLGIPVGAAAKRKPKK